MMNYGNNTKRLEGMEKTCKHKWIIVEFTSAEGYSAICMKCGKRQVIGFNISDFIQEDKKIHA